MLLLISGVVLFPSSLVYWAFNLRLAQLLRERHPSVWDRYLRRTGAAFGPAHNAANSFAWSRRDHELNDKELSHNARWLRRVSVVVYCAMGVWAVGVFRQFGAD